MAKISVVVPVYNVENYLARCLDSLINQTLSDIEIICVNDGSTDSSPVKLEEYAKRDSRIKIINQENGGLSAARNTGINAAGGEYIGFVDSDDYVDADFYEKLYLAAISNNADISCTSIIRKRPKSQKYRVNYEDEKIYTGLKDKLNVCKIPKCCYVWNKIYKTELIKNRLFRKGVYFEDVFWTPEVLKNANKLVTVSGTNYYYMVNPTSIVKSVQSKKKQQDAYNAKSYIVQFFKSNNIELSKKDRTITKSIKYIGKLPVMKVKEFENKNTYYLFGFLPVFVKKVNIPVIKDNTFFVWEPCSQSHSEVVPGYVKYLLDLGYHVSVLVNPDRYKEGLFSRFKDENVSYNKLTRPQSKQFFKNADLHNVKGVMVTTAGKLCDCIHYEQAYTHFNDSLDKSKLLLVEHESKFAIDAGTWDKWSDKLIMLRDLNFEDKKTIVVNPHYFGEVNITPKNKDITNFITIGALHSNKKNSQQIIDSVKVLHEQGYRNFKVTVVGKGSLKGLPKEIRSYFDIKGRLPFDKMYEEIEKADFMLTSYNDDDPEHIRYNTTGTSGNFQLVYGFLKPCVIIRSFAPLNGFDDTNAILYNKPENYHEALIKGIKMSEEEYFNMQNSLKVYVDKLYNQSKENLKRLIDGK